MLTPTHLAIVMEYAAGGELFERICNAGRFSEDEVSLSSVMASILVSSKDLILFFCSSLQDVVDHLLQMRVVFILQARFFFQQLVSGVSYCHSMVLILISSVSCYDDIDTYFYLGWF